MREADIRPADLLAEYLRLSAEDAKSVLGHGSDFIARACPACARDQAVHAFRKNGFTLSVCRNCRTLYVSPAPNTDSLDAFYRDSPSTRYWANVFFPAVADARREKIFRPRARTISAMLDGLGTRLIDVGAGYGLFIEEMRSIDPQLSVRAVEPGSDLANVCRDKQIETFNGFADEAAVEPNWRGWADLVTSFEVIEHVLDLRGFVRSLAALTRPGGRILITGLCGTGFDIDVLGVRSNAVSPPHHLNFISADGMKALSQGCGLDLVNFSTPGKLDVDIVCNALAEDPEAVTDPALRDRLLCADETEKQRIQDDLVARKRSSHMWAIMRRPHMSEATE